MASQVVTGGQQAPGSEGFVTFCSVRATRTPWSPLASPRGLPLVAVGRSDVSDDRFWRAMGSGAGSAAVRQARPGWRPCWPGVPPEPAVVVG